MRGKFGHVPGRIKTASYIVVDKANDVADRTGQHGAPGGHVFHDLERREVEVGKIGVWRNRDIHLRYQAGHFGRIDSTCQRCDRAKPCAVDLRIQRGTLGSIADDEQPEIPAPCPQRGSGADEMLKAVPRLERTDKTDGRALPRIERKRGRSG